MVAGRSPWRHQAVPNPGASPTGPIALPLPVGEAPGQPDRAIAARAAETPPPAEWFADPDCPARPADGPGGASDQGLPQPGNPAKILATY